MIAVKVRRERYFALLAFVSLFFIASCTTQGDFGRDRPSVFKDEVLPSLRNFVAQANDKPFTSFALTEKEQLLRTYRRRIGRDMAYPTVESYYAFLVASVGVEEQPLPHLGEEIRSRENSKKRVVDVPENAKTNPYALKSEIAEDIVIITRVRDLSLAILADDEIRFRRLASLRYVRQSDRDNVKVRARENVQRIKYIEHVATLRVERYWRTIDTMSIADPTLDLKPVRASVRELEIELNNFIRQLRNKKKGRPTMLVSVA